MLDTDIDFDRIILHGLGNLSFREQKYWCPDTELLDAEDFKYDRGL